MHSCFTGNFQNLRKEICLNFVNLIPNSYISIIILFNKLTINSVYHIVEIAFLQVLGLLRQSNNEIEKQPVLWLQSNYFLISTHSHQRICHFYGFFLCDSNLYFHHFSLILHHLGVTQMHSSLTFALFYILEYQVVCILFS